MSATYTVSRIKVSQLPQGIDPSEFGSEAWATSLNGKVVAVCFEEVVAQVIAEKNLARATVALGQIRWFALRVDDEVAGYCLGSVLPKANEYFGNS